MPDSHAVSQGSWARWSGALVPARVGDCLGKPQGAVGFFTSKCDCDCFKLPPRSQISSSLVGLLMGVLVGFPPGFLVGFANLGLLSK